MELQRDLARISKIFFFLQNSEFPMLSCEFNYDSTGSQNLGYFVDTVFLKKFMGVFGRNENGLYRLAGRECWVTYTRSAVLKIEPLMVTDGIVFDIRKWSAWKRAQPEMTAQQVNDLDFS